jgi:hypothetical protein
MISIDNLQLYIDCFKNEAQYPILIQDMRKGEDWVLGFIFEAIDI